VTRAAVFIIARRGRKSKPTVKAVAFFNILAVSPRIKNVYTHARIFRRHRHATFTSNYVTFIFNEHFLRGKRIALNALQNCSGARRVLGWVEFGKL